MADVGPRVHNAPFSFDAVFNLGSLFHLLRSEPEEPEEGAGEQSVYAQKAGDADFDDLERDLSAR